MNAQPPSERRWWSLQVLVVEGLEVLCTFLRHPFGCRLATIASDLDERWQTGRWVVIPWEEDSDDDQDRDE